ncbi:MAG: hypothetical protein ABL973_03385 [Micropepsaceae bacterium]
MAQAPADPSLRKQQLRRLLKISWPLAAITAALSLLAVVYLGFDLARAKVSPCDSIFQETSVSMSTKIKFLKAEGELKLGREKVAELGDRAQMAALGLKTCCVVLDAGRINPEQFLTCKGKARTYEAQVDNVVAKVRASVANPAAATPDLGTAVESAFATSRDLNQSVVKISSEQQLQSLQTAQTKKLAIGATEAEPNNDIPNANAITLQRTVKASVGLEKDADVYTFTTPPVHRDWVRIELQNLSTTLEPNIELFDSLKTSLGAVRNTTAGGDVAYEFVAAPATTYSFRVSSFYGSATGVYAVTVAPQKAFDSLEPNETILTAKRITEGTPVQAKIMDKLDVDYFEIDPAGGGERKLRLVVSNNSATLHPNLTVYDVSKTEITSVRNSTAGGDLSLDIKAASGKIYVRIGDYYNSDFGEYTLTVKPQ